jgi:hypothetical protein
VDEEPSETESDGQLKSVLDFSHITLIMGGRMEGLTLNGFEMKSQSSQVIPIGIAIDKVNLKGRTAFRMRFQ